MSDPIDQEIRILRAIFWSERDPEGRAFVPLADAYLRKGNPEEAVSLLEDGLGRHPDFASAHMVAARAYRAAGALGAVQRALGSVLELDPDNASALRMKGELAESEGNVPVALAAFREAVERNPDYEDLPGRIDRLAVGMSAVEPASSAPEGFEPSAHEAPARAFDAPGEALDTADTDFDVFDVPDRDFGAPGAALDEPEPDLADSMVFPQDEVAALTHDPSVAHDPDARAGEVHAVDAGTVDGDPLADFEDTVDAGVGVTGLKEAGTVDGEFGLDSFPSDGDMPPVDFIELEPDALVPEGLELDTGVPDRTWDASAERRTGDLEAHEALLAERGVDRSGEGVTTEDQKDPSSDDVDMIDPFGVEPAVQAAGNPESPSSTDQSSDLPADQAEDPDEDEVAWRLPPNAGTRRAAAGGEPLPVTRTLGELYARQGLISQAAGVFEALLERNPDDESVRARLAELRAESSDGAAAPPPDAAGVDGADVDESHAAGTDVAGPDEDATALDATPSDATDVAASSAALDAISPESETPSEIAGFSVASQPIGAWFDDLLAWSPGAVPVAHLAPGAVPIESLAPVASAAETDPAPRPAPVSSGDAPEMAHASPPAPEMERATEPPPEVDGPPESEAAPAFDASSASESASDQDAPEDADAAPSAGADPPAPTSSEDGFEGLDDFQDWLRSLNR